MSGFRFRVFDQDNNDLGTRTFGVPDFEPGDTVALQDRVYRVKRVDYFDEEFDEMGDELRGMLRLEPPR